MRRTAGISLLDLLAILAVVAILASVIVVVLVRLREESRRLRCRDNLTELAKAMVMYMLGDRFYMVPLGRCARGSGAETYNGAEWLASLYWTACVPDPDVFLCPSSGDTNAKGRDIGFQGVNDVAGGSFGSQTVSYAGMWWKSVNTLSGGGIRDDFPPSEAMACDDTQGGINHGTARDGGTSVLFFDGHVEFDTNRELDITSQTGSVGKRPGLLWRLKN